MTNKPMLSVERDLLVRLCNLSNFGWDDIEPEMKELRVLLDKPVVESEVDRLERRCKNAELALKVKTENCEALKAAQHQGEPVCAQIRYRRPEMGCPNWGEWHDLKLSHFDKNRTRYIDNAGWDCETRVLFAEQPAPVAVTHTMKSIMEAVEASRCYTVLTSDQCHAIAQVLNEVKP